jgi:transcriptional regulator with XRE-family HTH domain
MNDILKIIGSNVRFYRKHRQLSQEELADLAGLHRTYVGGIERGERNVSAENISKIALALHVEPFELLKPRKEQGA